MPGFVRLNAGCTVSVRTTRLNVSCLVDPGNGRGVTDLYLSRAYTHRQHERLKNHTQLCKAEFVIKSLDIDWSISQLKCSFYNFKYCTVDACLQLESRFGDKIT